MDHRQLGRSGLTVSVVGLGCNNSGGRIDVASSRAVVDAATDAGVTLLDTSNTYGDRGGSESALGEILRSRRDRVVLTTKWGMDMGEGPGTARASRPPVASVIAALDALGTDTVRV